MRFILVLVMFGAMMDVGGLESCFGKIQEEAGVNPDEMQGFIKGLNSEPGGVVSNMGDMANVLTKVKVLTKQGKSAEEVKSAIASDIEELSEKSSTVSSYMPQISVAIDTYVDTHQITPSTIPAKPAQNCPLSFKLNNGQIQNFSKLEGLDDDRTARQILPQIPADQLQCITGSKIMEISPSIIKEVAPGLVPMSTSLREDHLKSISNKKIEWGAKKKKVETISNQIATSLDQFDNKIDEFMKDWKAFVVYSTFDRSEWEKKYRNSGPSDFEIKEKIDEYKNAGTKSGHAYAAIYMAIDTNLKQLTTVMKGISDGGKGAGLEESKKAIVELFEKLPQGSLYEKGTSDLVRKIDGETELERIAEDVKRFKKSAITSLISDVIDYLEEKITKMSEKITELESEITELKTDTDKKS